MRPALTSVVLVALCLALAGTGSTAVTRTTVGVKIYDSRCTVSKKALKVGEAYDFVVANFVFSRHSFKINGKRTPMLGDPTSANGNMHILPVTFAKPGRYPYQCLGAGQSKPGMKGVVVVKAASSSGGLQGGG